MYRISVDLTGRDRSVFRPLETIRFTGKAPEEATVELRDGTGRHYASAEVQGEFAVNMTVGGALGNHRAILVNDEEGLLADTTFHADAKTGIECNSGRFGDMWLRLESMIRRTRTMYVLHGEPMTFYVPWVRDDVHVMKAFKYWEPEAGSLPEHFLELQRPDGMIFDYIRPAGFATKRMDVFGERFYEVDEEEDFRYDRLPVEADVEYLLIEGIYTAWQATGDDAWMARQLPGCKKAIDYMMSDPMRWSEEHGLIKRGYTIDTWDFKFFGFDRDHLKTAAEVQDAVFNVDENTPMCIMHGDNSGMYQACRQVARMHEALGHEEEAAEYDRKAAQFRENTNEHCWNGRYYDHWVPVTPLQLDQGGVDGCKVLSLSNPYDINRGLPEHDKCVSIIKEYMRLREELKDTHFAEWLSVHPCWPKGFDGHEAGTYVNGGIIIIVAGELAKAALHHGFEQYGADILSRVRDLMYEQFQAQKGSSDRDRQIGFHCTYEPDGTPSSGIPDNWAQAAVMSAMMEGLCGLRDGSTRFRHALVEPRWVAADVAEAVVTARYGASDGYVAYAYEHDPEARRITIQATGGGRRFDFHLLLPDGAKAKSVTTDGKTVDFANTSVEDSPYADFTLDGPLCSTIEIAY